ncbi:class I SAM-dependent methyltransferase [Nocardia sp. CDC160]|uniref:class I SAM-dependent methyltransferase n=1 Tax=Nocardia sp. CDC160 TaxID=3112166 RepID=UPI002DB86F0E|nr:methyltransferase domain-containing protein [Nocardia sp. CDC160]MEC3917521.1 methyltransferase domain-containing protein [Nocardia sp. CDC160]
MSENPLAAPGAWDEIAEDYDDVMSELMRPFAVHVVESAPLTGRSRVIDVATGPGVLALLAAPRVGEVVAVDFSEAMIRRLRRAVMQRGIGNVLTGVGDGQDLRYAANTFDAAFSMFGLMFFPDRGKGFAELFRVVRPGGTVVASSWAPVADSPLMTLLFEAYQAGIPGFPAPQANPNSLENPDVFELELIAAGFESVSVTPRAESFSYDSAEQMWEKLTRGSAPLQNMRRKTDAAEWAAQEKVMIDYLREHYVPGTELSTTAWIGTGRVPR